MWGHTASVQSRQTFMCLQKRYADDEDFQLTTAETALLAKQAAALQDYDMPSTPAAVPAADVPQPQLDSAAASTLHHSASSPAGATTTKTAAAAEAAKKNAAVKAGTPAPPHFAPTAAARTEAASAPADEAKAAVKQQEAVLLPASLQAVLKRLPASPARRSTQELHSGANAASPDAAGVAPVNSAAAGAADEADAANSAASEGAMQKSPGKIWRPPFAIGQAASPQRSSESSLHQAASRSQASSPAKSASPLKALAAQVGKQILTKKRKSMEFTSALSSLGSDSKAEKGSAGDGGVETGAGQGHAAGSRDLRAIAAQQMARAMAKHKSSTAPGISFACSIARVVVCTLACVRA